MAVTDGYSKWDVEIGGAEQTRKSAKRLGAHDQLFAILVKHSPKSTVEILLAVDHAGAMDHYTIEHGRFSSPPLCRLSMVDSSMMKGNNDGIAIGDVGLASRPLLPQINAGERGKISVGVRAGPWGLRVQSGRAAARAPI
ncbi:hypothetical protein [uncultured Agrobacterium sp.]|uniref:hypothetical protein n=1 Tax=uncultured Agrobacterium sp. TaxID=157277 RepID=UPI00260105ED|nr:hypothetical protein [uncultured Agrobacterium sp.]